MIRPMNDNVVLKVVQLEERSAGGLYLGTVKRVSNEAIVVAVGKGRVTSKRKLIEPSVRVGEHVVFDTNARSEKFKDTNSGEDLVVISEDHILGVLE